MSKYIQIDSLGQGATIFESGTEVMLKFSKSHFRFGIYGKKLSTYSNRMFSETKKRGHQWYRRAGERGEAGGEGGGRGRGGEGRGGTSICSCTHLSTILGQ